MEFLSLVSWISGDNAKAASPGRIMNDIHADAKSVAEIRLRKGTAPDSFNTGFGGKGRLDESIRNRPTRYLLHNVAIARKRCIDQFVCRSNLRKGTVTFSDELSEQAEISFTSDTGEQRFCASTDVISNSMAASRLFLQKINFKPLPGFSLREP
jgi:hypothetical protein